MKRTYSVLLLVLACLLVFTGCKCEHEWVEADCVTPRTCSLCQEIEGAPLGHTWAAATCETPKTCETCGTTEGEALGHNWVDAVCEAPKTCDRCKLTEGESLGHSWMDATTEAPKTCENCGKTEGERIITDERFTTAAASALFGKWEMKLNLPAADMGLEGLVEEIPVIYTFDFGNAGDLTMDLRFEDRAALVDTLAAVTAEQVFVEAEAEGISREEMDAAFVDEYGMTVAEYAISVFKGIDWNGLLDMFSLEFKYYVEGDQLYMDYSWEGEFREPATITIQGDTMTLADSLESNELKRVNP